MTRRGAVRAGRDGLWAPGNAPALPGGCSGRPGRFRGRWFAGYNSPFGPVRCDPADTDAGGVLMQMAKASTLPTDTKFLE